MRDAEEIQGDPAHELFREHRSRKNGGHRRGWLAGIPGERAGPGAERSATDQPGGHRLDVDRDGAGALDDAGAGLLLWRPGAIEERAQHDDDELRVARVRRRHLGARRVLARVRAGQRLDRRFVAAGPAGRHARRAGHDSARPVHGVSGDVRHHHCCAHLGSHRRADAVFRLSALHLVVGDCRLQPDHALGLGRRLARQARRPGLRRGHGRPRQRGRCGARCRARHRQAPAVSVLVAPTAQRAVHAAGRRAPLVRLVRIQRGKRGGRQRDRRARVRDDDVCARSDAGGLDGPGCDPIAQTDGRRRGNRHRRRPRGGHACGRLRQPS